MRRRATVLTAQIGQARRRRIVQMTHRAFNVDQVVALSNVGTDQTMVHTTGLDWLIDLPLAEAVRVLNGEDQA